MRFINYDLNAEKFTKIVYKETEDAYTNRGTVNGFIGENIVNSYYHLPWNNHPGIGDKVDAIINGAHVDIKCHNCSVNWFDNPHNRWFIQANSLEHKELDVYLCVLLDTKNKFIALAGWITPIEVIQLGKHYNKGEYIPGYPDPCNREAYVIELSQLHEIS